MTEPAFDVFLCHRSGDKPAVEEIGRALRERGLVPWLDVWELRPGLPWQRALEEQIRTIGAVAVFVGAGGRRPWQDLEIEALRRSEAAAKLCSWGRASPGVSAPAAIPRSAASRRSRTPSGSWRPWTLFENLEDGASVDDFLEWFPDVARAQVEAVLDHASASLVVTASTA